MDSTSSISNATGEQLNNNSTEPDGAFAVLYTGAGICYIGLIMNVTACVLICCNRLVEFTKHTFCPASIDVG